MKQIIAGPPQSSDEPWSAWLIADRHEPSLSSRGTVDAERIEGSPQQWPKGSLVVLVIPVLKLSWHQAELPRLPAHRLRAALAGLLEEQLLDDPEHLHLALAPGWKVGSTDVVAVCDKAWLFKAAGLIRDAGHDLERIVPEFEPGAAAQWVIEQDQGLWVRTDAKHVQVLPLGVHPAWPEPALGADGADEVLWSEPQVAEAAEKALRRRPELISRSRRMVRAAQSSWDLAQFDLAGGGSRRWYNRLARLWQQAWDAPQWRPLRWALGALIAVHAVGLQVWAFNESRLQKDQAQQRIEVMRSTFPQITVVIDPLPQMQREVQALARSSGAGTASDLGVMLTALAEAGAPPPKQLEFTLGLLSLRGWPLSEPQAKQLRTALAQKGYGLDGAAAQWHIRSLTP